MVFARETVLEQKKTGRNLRFFIAANDLDETIEDLKYVAQEKKIRPNIFKTILMDDTGPTATHEIVDVVVVDIAEEKAEPLREKIREIASEYTDLRYLFKETTDDN